ncbi:hypothetical protein LAZ67_5003371 [Cordylochernes scorpioides]|uniref:Uncharacterized protein n=1 Tax=Cordylochernes scorpioides TaxID=51811 RepID=A0ABY6KH86_9ARAC|nr:hypothetical protein LAZ67_5003371 [Cordylochernes scorpioides]
MLLAGGLDPDPALEAYLREILDNFKQEMQNGLPALKVPPLDPLVLEEKDVVVDDEHTKLKINFPQINVHGLSTFSVPLLHSNLDQFHVRLQLNISQVTLDGLYDMKGRVARIFPLHGNGEFNINLTDIQIHGEARLDVRPRHMSVAHLELDLNWGQLTIFLENFLGGGSFAQALQRMLPVIGKGIFNKFRPQILTELNSALVKEINKELAKPQVQDIISAIFPSF